MPPPVAVPKPGNFCTPLGVMPFRGVIFATARSTSRSIAHIASTLTLYRLCTASRSATSAPHHPGDQRANLRRPDPLPTPDAAARADLRPDRLHHDADPHLAPGSAVPLLRLHQRHQAR